MTTAHVVLQPLDRHGRGLLFTDARTARTFTNHPVDAAQLREIYELMKWGPTWSNTLPLRVVYIRTREGRARLLPHLSAGNVESARQAPVNAVLAVDDAYHELVPRLFPPRPELRDRLERDPALRERVQAIGGGMQAAYFLMAVRAVGLVAGPIGGFDREGLDAELFPDGDWRSLLVVNIGYPGDEAWHERLPRLRYDEAVRTI